MKFLILCVLVLAGCAKPAPSVDELNAADQARLQAQADREREARKP